MAGVRRDAGHKQGARQEIEHGRPFGSHCGEPPIVAGSDDDPVEYLLYALAGCIAASKVPHVALRGIEIEELESQVEGDLDVRGFFRLDDDVPKGFHTPVFNTLTHGAKVDVTVEPK